MILATKNPDRYGRGFLLLYEFDDFLEDGGLVLGEIGEDLAVELHALHFELIDELAVLHALGPGAGVDLDVPGLARRPFLLFPSAELAGEAVEERFFCGAFLRFAAPFEAFGELQKLFALLVGDGAPFNSRH